MKKEKQYRYSEIFGRTIQGEGRYCGVPTVWVRWWGCNFECRGFGQKDLDNPESWELPFETFDVNSVEKLEDLPVWHTGCDSSYSWSKNFRHLAHMDTAEGIANKLVNLMRNEFNPEGKFVHPKSNQITHLCFTGGEPIMSQNAIADVMEYFDHTNNYPLNITVETNGTQNVKDKLAHIIKRHAGYGTATKVHEWFWSVSPKLRASGEKFEEAINPEVVAQYAELSNFGQLKYVVDGSDRTWEEVERATKMYRDAGIEWPVWIMPVGADLEMQEEVAANVARQAIDRGYNVAPRVHVYLFGNTIGV